MNHIQRLQADLQSATAKVQAMQTEIMEFRKHLQSSKFHNTETAQNDWIAVADVHRWLDNINN